jgi:hypothetical protein
MSIEEDIPTVPILPALKTHLYSSLLLFFYPISLQAVSEDWILCRSPGVTPYQFEDLGLDIPSSV